MSAETTSCVQNLIREIEKIEWDIFNSKYPPESQESRLNHLRDICKDYVMALDANNISQEKIYIRDREELKEKLKHFKKIFKKISPKDHSISKALKNLDKILKGDIIDIAQIRKTHDLFIPSITSQLHTGKDFGSTCDRLLNNMENDAGDIRLFLSPAALACLTKLIKQTNKILGNKKLDNSAKLDILYPLYEETKKTLRVLAKEFLYYGEHFSIYELDYYGGAYSIEDIMINEGDELEEQVLENLGALLKKKWANGQNQNDKAEEIFEDEDELMVADALEDNKADAIIQDRLIKSYVKAFSFIVTAQVRIFLEKKFKKTVNESHELQCLEQMVFLLIENSSTFEKEFIRERIRFFMENPPSDSAHPKINKPFISLPTRFHSKAKSQNKVQGADKVIKSAPVKSSGPTLQTPVVHSELHSPSEQTIPDAPRRHNPTYFPADIALEEQPGLSTKDLLIRPEDVASPHNSRVQQPDLMIGNSSIGPEEVAPNHGPRVQSKASSSLRIMPLSKRALSEVPPHSSQAEPAAPLGIKTSTCKFFDKKSTTIQSTEESSQLDTRNIHHPELFLSYEDNPNGSEPSSPDLGQSSPSSKSSSRH